MLQGITFKELLGTGFFGIVLKATDEHGLDHALKLCHSHPSSSPEFCNREVDCLLRLPGHPNVVGVFAAAHIDFKTQHLDALKDLLPLGTPIHGLILSFIHKVSTGSTVSLPAIKMELCGETLTDWMNVYQTQYNRSSSELQDMQTSIINGIRDGLKFIHSKDIIHRDLKPDNILFSAKGFGLGVKIADFGLSRTLPDVADAELSSRTGNLMYRAPERDGRDYNELSDLFSVGLIMLEVVSLIPPSLKSNLFRKLTKDGNTAIIGYHPQFPNAKAMITSLTNSDPKERLRYWNSPLLVAKTHAAPLLVLCDTEQIQVTTVEEGATVALPQYISRTLSKSRPSQAAGTTDEEESEIPLETPRDWKLDLMLPPTIPLRSYLGNSNAEKDMQRLMSHLHFPKLVLDPEEMTVDIFLKAWTVIGKDVINILYEELDKMRGSPVYVADVVSLACSSATKRVALGVCDGRLDQDESDTRKSSILNKLFTSPSKPSTFSEKLKNVGLNDISVEVSKCSLKFIDETLSILSPIAPIRMPVGWLALTCVQIGIARGTALVDVLGTDRNESVNDLVADIHLQYYMYLLHACCDGDRKLALEAYKAPFTSIKTWLVKELVNLYGEQLDDRLKKISRWLYFRFEGQYYYESFLRDTGYGKCETVILLDIMKAKDGRKWDWSHGNVPFLEDASRFMVNEAIRGLAAYILRFAEECAQCGALCYRRTKQWSTLNPVKRHFESHQPLGCRGGRIEGTSELSPFICTHKGDRADEMLQSDKMKDEEEDSTIRSMMRWIFLLMQNDFCESYGLQTPSAKHLIEAGYSDLPPVSILLAKARTLLATKRQYE